MYNRTNPFISVIVPVYNVAPYVEACLKSIICQSYENLEILIVDDASTDSGYNICLKFAVYGKDHRFHNTSEKVNAVALLYYLT